MRHFTVRFFTASSFLLTAQHDAVFERYTYYAKKLLARYWILFVWALMASGNLDETVRGQTNSCVETRSTQLGLPGLLTTIPEWRIDPYRTVHRDEILASLVAAKCDKSPISTAERNIAENIARDVYHRR
jgi:hypothetical protein